MRRGAISGGKGRALMWAVAAALLAVFGLFTTNDAAIWASAYALIVALLESSIPSARSR